MNRDKVTHKEDIIIGCEYVASHDEDDKGACGEWDGGTCNVSVDTQNDDVSQDRVQ